MDKETQEDSHSNTLMDGHIAEVPDGAQEPLNGKPWAAKNIEPVVTDADSSPPSRCDRCQASCLLCCRPCMTHYNPLPTDPSVSQRLSYACMCPPHGKLARAVTLLLAVLCCWGVLWGVTGSHALPGGNFFALLVLVVCASIGGFLVEKIKLPPLLGKEYIILKLLKALFCKITCITISSKFI